MNQKSAENDDEFEDVKEEREMEELNEKGFRPSNFLVFQTYLWRTFSKPYKNKKSWRYVPPRNHVEKVRDIADTWLEKGAISVDKVFQISLFTYYAVYNSMVGTKISTKKQVAA